MYSYESFTPIHGPRLNLSQLSEKDIEEAVRLLYSPTTWAVVVRGYNNPERLYDYFRGFIEKDRNRESLSLVVRVNETGEIAGVSRFHSAGPGFQRVEIGYTWIADRWTRTFVNTEKKYLMIRYAFDTIGVKRVEFSVDPKNDKSNQAMKRLGAVFEGTLRKWRFLNETDPGHRNIYSIVDDEWPGVKARFEGSLLRFNR